MDGEYDGDGRMEQVPVQDQYENLGPEYRNPKNYAYYPSYYMKKIVPAGKFTHKSDSLYNIIQQS